MSHLCTMHCPPLSKEWTGGAHFGERNSWRLAHPSCPFKAPTTPQPHPPPCGRRVGGHLFRREHLPRHSPVSHEEGGDQHLSLLGFKLERRTTCTRRILRWGDLFSGQCPNTLSSVEDQITDQKTEFCCNSGLLHSWS